MTAKIDTTVKCWCKTCEKATASIRVIYDAGRHYLVCAECRNP